MAVHAMLIPISMTYIREYTELSAKEQRQLSFKRQYKHTHPDWDDSMVLLTRLVSERISSNVAVLDIGCGHGNFVIDELAGRFRKRIGFDLARESTTNNTSVEQVFIGNDKELPFTDEAFDLALSLWTLEHVKHPVFLFKEIQRILKPGGIFAFVTPNRPSLLIFIRRLMSKRVADWLLEYFYGRNDDDVFEVYYRANDAATLRYLAQEAGLKIDYIRENEDPSYTSFGRNTYALSAMFSRLPWAVSKPHLIAVLRKPA